MSKIRVFIDSSVYISWLNKEPEHDNIEKIKEFIEDGKIDVVTTLDIMLEIFKGGNGTKDWEKVEINFRPKKHYLTPNFIIGDVNGSYKAYLDECKKKWDSLSELICDPKDSKHFISAESLGSAKYYLALDKDFFKKMKDKGIDYIKDMQLVTPDELIKIVNKSG